MSNDKSSAAPGLAEAVEALEGAQGRYRCENVIHSPGAESCIEILSETAWCADCTVKATLPALRSAAEREKALVLELDAALEEPDFRCPECGSFDTEELHYEDDFSSRRCNECSFYGGPGEDFPTSTELVYEAATLRATNAALERDVLETARLHSEECKLTQRVYAESYRQEARADTAEATNAALAARVGELFKTGLHFWSNAECAPSCGSIIGPVDTECDCGHDALEMALRETGLPLTLPGPAPVEPEGERGA